MSVDDLKCGALTVSMASSPTETNGAPIRVNGEGAFGLVTFSHPSSVFFFQVQKASFGRDFFPFSIRNQMKARQIILTGSYRKIKLLLS